MSGIVQPGRQVSLEAEMLSKEDNELITNIEKGQPMGELFRRFWLPVALAEELPGPDCVPLRVQVLGEKLVAFRDTDGRPGLLDAYCPHRGAPLFFGRNEENGLRCIYHGWKFDVDGVCTDVPNAPEGEVFKHKVKIKRYPCVEAGGMIWSYMGPADKQPPFPEFEWTKLPRNHVYVTKFVMECNYLQAMEGDYDPGHGPFLHSNMDGSPQGPLFGTQVRTRIRPVPENEPFPHAVGSRRQTEADRATWGRIEDTETGVFFIQSAERPDGTKVATVAPWMMPIYCTAGRTGGTTTMATNIRVPIDNERIYFYRLRWNYDPIPDAEIHEYKHGGWYYPEMNPGTYVPKANMHNDYLIDRQTQRTLTYSGIGCFPLQDIAMMEDQWGPLADRTQEHLTTSDFEIIYIRRRLLKTVRALMEGVEPQEPWHPKGYAFHRSSVLTKEGTLDDVVAKAKEMARTQNVKAEAPMIPVS